MAVLTVKLNAQDNEVQDRYTYLSWRLLQARKCSRAGTASRRVQYQGEWLARSIIGTGCGGILAVEEIRRESAERIKITSSQRTSHRVHDGAAKQASGSVVDDVSFNTPCASRLLPK